MQQFLLSLLPPLKASGASQKVVTDLESAFRSLESFREMSVETFSAFLVRAEEYDRTGIVPIAAKPAPKPRAKKDATPVPSPTEALAVVKDLYERSTEADVTYDRIKAELAFLDKLTKPGLDEVSSGFGLGKLKTKKAAVDAIHAKIEGYKKSYQRTQF